MFTGHTEIQLVVATATWRSHYLILGGFPAAFGVPISQDDALFVNSGLLLAALFEHPDFQATSQDDGSVTYRHTHTHTTNTNMSSVLCFTNRTRASTL